MNTLDFYSIGSARFLKFMPFILKWECSWPDDQSGQESNDPDDPGGDTKWGIDKNSSPNVDIHNLTLEGALQIYYTQYWQKNHCESDPLGMGEVYMNACVNCGTARACFWFMPKFKGDIVTPSVFLDRQELYYKNLASEHVHLAKFLKGWLNRTSDLRLWLAHNLEQTSPASPQSVV